MQQKLSEIEAKQQPASTTASVSESQVPVSPVWNVFGMPTMPVVKQQVVIPSTVQKRNILWTPVTSAGISLPLPLDSCCSVSLVSQHHAYYVAQACPNLKLQKLSSPVPVSVANPIASLSGVAIMEVSIIWTSGKESILSCLLFLGELGKFSLAITT